MKTACVLSVLLAANQVSAAEPADLIKAKQAYEQASEIALKPVKAAYWKELTRLIEEYTRAGKLEEALSVKAELTKLSGGAMTILPTASNVTSADLSQLRERFVGRTFVTPGGTHFTFLKDGTGTQTWSEGSESFKWDIRDARTVHAKLPEKQYFFWFESRFKGEIADALEATRRPVKVKE